MEKKYCYSCMNILEGEVCPVCGGHNIRNKPGQLRCGILLNKRYIVGKCLGQGGFGITYIGLDTTLETPVAIKEFFPNSVVSRSSNETNDVEISDLGMTGFFNSGKDKFLQEARLVARFKSDPNVVYVSDFFEENNTAYIVMEYITGSSLSDCLINEGIMNIDKVLELLRPIVRTLANLHEHGLLHRDISPSNIMMTENGTLKLLDFGSARQAGQQGSMTVFSKPGYSPVEQYFEDGVQGPWSDVYSLCATIYRLITGITPDASLKRHVDDHLLPPSAFKLHIPISPEQEKGLMHGLQINREDRIQNMAQLERELFDVKGAASEIKAVADPDDHRVPSDLEGTVTDPDSDPVSCSGQRRKSRDIITHTTTQFPNFRLSDVTGGKKVFCPVCGSVLKNPTAKFCGKCGSPVKPVS